MVVFKLLVYHLSISYKNLTTYQDIKKNYINDAEYFFINTIRGRILNIFKRFCKRNPKAFFDPGGIYKTSVTIYCKENKEKNLDNLIELEGIKLNAFPSPLNSKESSSYKGNDEDKFVTEKSVALPKNKYEHYSQNNINIDEKSVYDGQKFSDEEICRNIEMDSEILCHEYKMNKILAQLDKRHLDQQNIISIKSSSQSLKDLDKGNSSDGNFDNFLFLKYLEISGECEDWELFHDIPLQLFRDKEIKDKNSFKNKFSLDLNKWTNQIKSPNNILELEEDNLLSLQLSHRNFNSFEKKARSKESLIDSIRMQLELRLTSDTKHKSLTERKSK